MNYEDGLCHRPENRDLDWFSEDPEVIDTCRKICYSCPIRFECAQEALNNREIHGMWGGMDDYRVRRALSVDIFGDIRRRVYKQHCPFCDSHDLTYANKKYLEKYTVECNDCGIEWKSHIIPVKIRRALERKYGDDMGKFVETL